MRRRSPVVVHGSIVRPVTSTPVFDGHNDALIVAGADALAEGRSDGHLDLPRMRRGGMVGGFFAVFVASPTSGGRIDRPDGSFAFPYAAPVAHDVAVTATTAAVETLHELERRGSLRIARTIDDVAAATVDRPVAILHLEGAEAIGADLALFERWYEAGVRSIGPLWSRRNAFGQGVPFVFPGGADTGPGLTEEGVALVHHCADHGVLVDLSHMNAAAFWEVARLDLGPLVVTHGAVHTISPCSRNLADEQIDAVGASGGVVGINFATPFLRSDFAEDSATPLEQVVAHIAYVAERIGVAHVAFGSDFDGAPMPADLAGPDSYPGLMAALGHAGFSAEEIEAVASRNWHRVLAAAWS